MNEQQLIETLVRLEALWAGTPLAGEQVAAAEAQERILRRLRELQREDPPVEFKFSLLDVWSRKLFLALLRRYGLSPYRYSGQRHTTVMARVSKRFVDETLWPEFQELDAMLRKYLEEVTNKVICQTFHQDSSEAAEVKAQRQLEAKE